jgi:hypothetical protein
MWTLALKTSPLNFLMRSPCLPRLCISLTIDKRKESRSLGWPGMIASWNRYSSVYLKKSWKNATNVYNASFGIDLTLPGRHILRVGYVCRLLVFFVVFCCCECVVNQNSYKLNEGWLVLKSTRSWDITVHLPQSASHRDHFLYFHCHLQLCYFLTQLLLEQRMFEMVLTTNSNITILSSRLWKYLDITIFWVTSSPIFNCRQKSNRCFELAYFQILLECTIKYKSCSNWKFVIGKKEKFT